MLHSSTTFLTIFTILRYNLYLYNILEMLWLLNLPNSYWLITWTMWQQDYSISNGAFFSSSTIRRWHTFCFKFRSSCSPSLSPSPIFLLTNEGATTFLMLSAGRQISKHILEHSRKKLELMSLPRWINSRRWMHKTLHFNVARCAPKWSTQDNSEHLGQQKMLHINL